MTSFWAIMTSSLFLKFAITNPDMCVCVEGGGFKWCHNVEEFPQKILVKKMYFPTSTLVCNESILWEGIYVLSKSKTVSDIMNRSVLISDI